MPKLPPADRRPVPSLFDRLRAALKGSDTPLADLERSANQAAEARDQVLSEKAALDARRLDMLVADDNVRALYQSDLSRVTDEAERLAVLADRLAGRLAEARAAAEQERRQAIYAGAQAKAVEASRALAKEYPRICGNLLSLMGTLAQAQADVASANEQLPDGAAGIMNPELTARGVPYRPRRVVAEKEVECWVSLDQMQPVPEPYQSLITPTRQKDGWGFRPAWTDADGLKHVADTEPTFLRARFIRREIENQSYADNPLPLAAALRLPALRGDGLLWGIGDVQGAVGMMALATASGAANPSNVLHRVSEVEVAMTLAAVVPKPVIKVEWEMTGYVGATPLTRNRHKSYSRGDGEAVPARDPETTPRAIPSSHIGLTRSANQIQAAKAAVTPTRLVSPEGIPNSVVR